jgi:hypothetical protein
MSLFKEWNELINEVQTKPSQKQFWKTYLQKEKDNYEKILESCNPVVEGNLAELAERYDMDPVTFVGFLDGINTSLTDPLDLNSLDESSYLVLNIDYEKLYFNMLDAKADWLYNLPQWEGILSKEARKDITKNYRKSKMAVSSKVGRNEPCPCGSGLKYKKCCGK